jgi:hypothetical protein
MRSLGAALVLLAGCAAREAPLPVPAVEPGRLRVVARAAKTLGAVQPVAVAVTNGSDEPLRLDARQVYALGADAARFAPLPPAEAARQADGRHLPGAVRGGAIGVASGGAFGALGGLIAGAIQGGIGAAVAVGSAVGAAVGAGGGVIGGGTASAPDVAGFQDRALPNTTLASGLSATGYVYFPAGDYGALELLAGEGTLRERVPIQPRP